MTSTDFNLIYVLRTLLAWKKQILALAVVSAVTAAIFSVFVMDEYYYSWSTFYPTNQYLSDRSMIFNSESTGGQVEYFGSKNDVNRVLTIANSSAIIDYVIDSFKLAEHYKINKSEKYWRTRVVKKFEKNYEAIKTEREAVEVSLYDTDPALAAKIVNAIVERVDEINKAHVNDNKQKLYTLLANQIKQQNEKVERYVDTLSSLAAQYNIKVSSNTGSSIVVEGSNFRAVQQYKALLEKQENALKELNNRNNILEQMEVSMGSNSSSLFIVETAFVADRRERPVRSLVVLVTVLITVFVSMLGVLVIDQWRTIKAQL